MSTLPGDVPEEQLKAESAQIKDAEALHDNAKTIHVVETKPEVIPETPEPVVDERLAILEARAQRNKPEAVEEKPVDDLPIWRSIDGVLMTRAKVNGVEQEVPYDDVLVKYQKESSADLKFREAAALRQENETLKAQIAQSNTQPSNDVGVSDLPKDDQQGITIETLNKAFLDGDEQAQKELTNRLNRNVDVNQLTEQAAILALRKVQEENHKTQIQQAITAASQKDPVYAQISGDEDFFGIADRASVSIFEQDPSLTPAQLVEKAFEFTATKLNLRADPLSTRTTKKEAHARSNLQGNSSRQSFVQEREPLTPETVRAQMRANRDYG